MKQVDLFLSLVQLAFSWNSKWAFLLEFLVHNSIWYLIIIIALFIIWLLSLHYFTVAIW